MNEFNFNFIRSSFTVALSYYFFYIGKICIIKNIFFRFQHWKSNLLGGAHFQCVIFYYTFFTSCSYCQHIKKKKSKWINAGFDALKLKVINMFALSRAFIRSLILMAYGRCSKSKDIEFEKILALVLMLAAFHEIANKMKRSLIATYVEKWIFDGFDVA